MLRTRTIQLDDHPRQHIHHYHQVAMVLHGRISITVDGHREDVCRMQACVVPGGSNHGFEGDGDNRLLLLDLDEQDWPDEDRANRERLFSSSRLLTLDAAFLNLLDYAALELQSYPDDASLARSLGHTLLCALSLRLSNRRVRPDDKTLDMPRLEKHIQENLTRQVTVDELAGIACLSPSHFHAQFKRAFGQTPHQYLLRARLDKACRLLRETALSVVNIAEDCGFSSQSALTTAMRRSLGITPRQLRDLP